MVEAALVDIDGTLMDNTALHALAWQRAFRRVGRQVDLGTIVHLIGMGSDKLAPEVLGAGEEEAAERAREYHPEEYLEKGLAGHTEPLPGALDLLRELKARGVRVALVSSATEQELERYLPLLDGARDVDAIVTKDDVSATKPEAGPFAMGLEKLGDPASAVVIADTVWDVQAAAKTGLPCACVLTGSIESGLLVEAGAIGVYRDAADLLAHLDDVLAPVQPEELVLGNS